MQTGEAAMVAAHQVPAVQAYLAHLRARGIDFLYLGSGSDTAPLVQAYEEAVATLARVLAEARLPVIMCTASSADQIKHRA